MAQDIHYEIFSRLGAKGGWRLHDVLSQREAALSVARGLMENDQATGVKVVKETYNSETGEYLSLKILEDGHTQMKVEPAAEDAPHALPCFKPDDLYSYHARTTMARLLSDYLARRKLTVTELIHRADALEMLEATGTLYQHAIQKVAVAQAASTSVPVQQIVKSLNELATNAIHQVYRDARAQRFPVTQAGQFALLASKLCKQGDARYVLNGALAQFLAGDSGWDDKLAKLLGLLDELPQDDAPRQLMLSVLDALVAEILHGSAALHELMGTQENLGESLLALVELFIGKQTAMRTRRGVEMLAERFAKDELPDARSAIASRILAELKSVKRLCPDGVVEELKMLRRIANQLVLAQGKYLAHEDIIAAFTLRSRRVISHEVIGDYLSDAASPDERLERLCQIEEHIIGQENKRNLGAFVMPVLQSAHFENHFLRSSIPPMQRLARLTELQLRVRRSAFQDIQRREIGEALDRIACQIEAHIKLFETVQSKSPEACERVNALLRLFSGKVLTEGHMAGRARAMILSCIEVPGFLTNYTAQLPPGSDGVRLDAQAAIEHLTRALGQAGITSETGLKSIAA